MKTAALLLVVGAAGLYCDDKPSCTTGCLAKRRGKNKISCKTDWGPRECARKAGGSRFEATKWCPEPCDEFPDCDCVIEKDHGARQCVNARSYNQCFRKGGKPGTAKSTWCGPNPSTDTIMQCFKKEGKFANVVDVCNDCCPFCSPVHTDNFESRLDWISLDNGNTEFWDTKGAGCACVDVDANDFDVSLSSKGDCVRLAGDRNNVWGGGGDDVVFATSSEFATSGDRINVHGGHGNDIISVKAIAPAKSTITGGWGDDQLTLEGEGGNINAGDGDDVCTSLGDNDLFPLSSNTGVCETCYDATGEVSCPTEGAAGVRVKRA